MFKEKSTKKRIVTPQNTKDASTLDARHQQMIQQMAQQHANMKELSAIQETCQQQKAYWEGEIQRMKELQQIDTAEYELAWTSNLHFTERLKRLSRQIEDIQESKEEIEYYENTANILFQYYELLENQNETTTQTMNLVPTRATKGRKKLLPVASKSILEALNISTPKENIEEDSPMQKAMPVCVDKSTLVDEYLAKVDPYHVKGKAFTDNFGNCEECNTQLICLQQDGVMVCPECGYQELLLVEQNRPILRQPTKETSHFSYKRLNHFKEWCAQIQGKESTYIPEEIFERILGEIKKEKITDPKKITYTKMREILKRLRINKYYEHINYIINRINGVPTPHFPPELEERLCSMFKEIQGPFLRHCPVERKNFLSYSYVLHQFFRILGQSEPSYLKYLSLFPLLKSREKLAVQDQIFKAVCADLGWPFIPSL